jgi:hypothetical protein
MKMKSLIVLTMFLGFAAHAEEANMSCAPVVTCSDVSKEKRQCIVKQDCEPQFKKLKAQIRKLEKENAELQAKKAVVPAPVVVEKEVVKEVVKEVIVEKELEPKRHNLSLLAGKSYTNFEYEVVSPNYAVVRSERKLDAGLMYQYNFTKKYRGSALATVNGVTLLGFGVNF